MDLDFVHDEGAGRYELRDQGETVALADYRIEDEVVILHHTFVDPDRRREGLAAILVGMVLDDVRAAGRLVDPTCWYVAGFIDARHGYKDMRVK